MNLPCSCKINYCASCWDRALAASVATGGKALCPSCRTGFHVDFNQGDACLVYSKSEEVMTIVEWRTRLYDKIRLAQIELLKDFGLAGALSPKCNFQRMQSPSGCEPSCICGGVLEKVDRRTRIIRMLEDTQLGKSARVPKHYIDELAAVSLTCDLCDEPATRTDFIWTCKKGPRTMMHPAALDVCESCFSRYAGGSSVPNNISPAHTSKNSCEHATRDSLHGILLGEHRPSQIQDFNGGRSSEGDDSSPRRPNASLRARFKPSTHPRIATL